ncbi:Uncharacterised protein [Nocardiopsis dassonvillei]|nr:Uncharacterised protein [Nocardiopsis dassonvillei]
MLPAHAGMVPGSPPAPSARSRAPRARGDGPYFPTGTAPPPASARALAASALRLPYQFTFPKELDRAITELETDLVLAWQTKDAHWIAEELILFLDEDDRAELTGFRLHYTPTDGLEVHRAD